MDLDFIARLLDLVERSRIAELDLTLDGARLRLVKSHAGAPSATGQFPMPAPSEASIAAAVPSPSATAQGKRRPIRAGFPGTFYRAPAPGAPPFTREGERVEDGTQIAIVEAMKTMNPVEADLAGLVRRIVPADGEPVETGDLLFEIEPDA